MNPYVLIVEDEAALATLLDYNLVKSGLQTAIARGGEEALLIISERPPDLIILDWMLPELSGIEVCRRLRANKATRAIPIIMLTARGEERDRVRGLETGADDYITKPFSVKELLARVQAVLRRSNPALTSDEIVHRDIVLNRSTHKVLRGGQCVHLGPTEFRLLEYFMSQPGRVFSRAQLLDAVWGHEVDVEMRTVDVHVGRLRKAVNKGFDADAIRTIRSAGYAMTD